MDLGWKILFAYCLGTYFLTIIFFSKNIKEVREISPIFEMFTEKQLFITLTILSPISVTISLPLLVVYIKHSIQNYILNKRFAKNQKLIDDINSGKYKGKKLSKRKAKKMFNEIFPKAK